MIARDAEINIISASERNKSVRDSRSSSMMGSIMRNGIDIVNIAAYSIYTVTQAQT